MDFASEFEYLKDNIRPSQLQVVHFSKRYCSLVKSVCDLLLHGVWIKKDDSQHLRWPIDDDVRLSANTSYEHMDSFGDWSLAARADPTVEHVWKAADGITRLARTLKVHVEKSWNSDLVQHAQAIKDSMPQHALLMTNQPFRDADARATLGGMIAGLVKNPSYRASSSLLGFF